MRCNPAENSRAPSNPGSGVREEVSMPKEIDPKDTTRAAAYELWMKAPNPMVTFFKTFDVTNLVRVSRKRKSGSAGKES